MSRCAHSSDFFDVIYLFLELFAKTKSLKMLVKNNL